MRRNSGGYSLLELMFVSLIMSALTGVGILTWNSVQQRTQDSTAEVNLQSVAGAQLSHQQSRGSWATGAAQLQSIAGGISISDSPSSGPSQVSVAEDDSGRLVLAVRSESGKCLAARLDPGGGEGSGNTVEVDLPLNCAAGSVISVAVLP